MVNAVFVYGSLMYAPVWDSVVCGHYSWTQATAESLIRLSVPGETYPALIPSHGHRTVGRLWRDVSDADLERLDRFEGGEYERRLIEVITADGPTSAWVYLWTKPESLIHSSLWDVNLFESTGLAIFLNKHVKSWTTSGRRQAGES